MTQVPNKRMTAGEWTEWFYANPSVVPGLPSPVPYNVLERARINFLAELQGKGLLIQDADSTDWVAFRDLLNGGEANA